MNTDFLVSSTRILLSSGANLTVGGNQMRRRSDLNSVPVTTLLCEVSIQCKWTSQGSDIWLVKEVYILFTVLLNSHISDLFS